MAIHHVLGGVGGLERAQQAVAHRAGQHLRRAVDQGAHARTLEPTASPPPQQHPGSVSAAGPTESAGAPSLTDSLRRLVTSLALGRWLAVRPMRLSIICVPFRPLPTHASQAPVPFAHPSLVSLLSYLQGLAGEPE